MGEEKAPAEGETRRDRRIQRQRQDIMDAAASLFAEKGYAATTTKDIARSADIGESTLYSYFAGKREILLAILDHQASQIDDILASITTLGDVQSYIDALDRLLERLFARVDYTRALIAEAWVNTGILNEYVLGRAARMNQFLEALVNEKIRAGVLRPVDARLAAQLIIATCISAMLPVLRGIQPPPDAAGRKYLAEMIIRLILDGIAIHPAG